MDMIIGGAIFALAFLLGAVFRPYLTGYSTKKGENLATHEDIEKLVDQVRAVTTTTKEIETKISGELWDRQKQWELKRDLLLDLAKKEAAVSDAMSRLDAILMTERKNREEGKPPRQEKVDEIATVWGNAADEFDRAAMLVNLVCGKGIRDAAGNFGLMNRRLCQEITEGHPEAFHQKINAWAARRLELSARIREELGQPSATEAPAAPKLASKP